MPTQIHLSKELLELNKKFLQTLYNSGNLINAKKNFEIIPDDGTWQRKPDKTMTLEAFLEILTQKAHIVLQIESPSHENIIYCANQDHNFAWVECPSTKENYQTISSIFLKIYGKELHK